MTYTPLPSPQFFRSVHAGGRSGCDIYHPCGVVRPSRPARMVEAARDDFDAVGAHPIVHREIFRHVPRRDLVLVVEHRPQGTQRGECSRVDVDREHALGGEHEGVEAGLGELLDQRGQGLADPFGLVAVLLDALSHEAEVALAVGVTHECRTACRRQKFLELTDGGDGGGGGCEWMWIANMLSGVGMRAVRLDSGNFLISVAKAWLTPSASSPCSSMLCRTKRK